MFTQVDFERIFGEKNPHDSKQKGQKNKVNISKVYKKNLALYQL